MITEDYYGFTNARPIRQLKLEHNSRIKEKPQKNSSSGNNHPIIRSLRRTELSNERLRSKDQKKQRKVVSPKQVHLKQNKQLQSALKVVPSQNEFSLSNQQQIQMMVKKYGNYKYTDSYQFRGNETSRDNKSNCIPEQQCRNRVKREAKVSGRETIKYNKQLHKEQGQYRVNRNCYSLSRDKRQDFLVHFQRDQLHQHNMIDRFAERVIIPGLLRKSKSLSAKPLLKYKMHTYYNVQKRDYYDYNESGYLTERQCELINRIEKRSLDAFDRAFPDYKRRIKQKQSKKFQVEENSNLQHRNSGILSNLREQFEQINNKNLYSIGTEKILENLQKQLTSQKYDQSADILINSRKSSKLADDYQMGASSFKKNPEKQSIAKLPQPKDIFQNFARPSTQEDSLLQFKPRKVKEEKILQEESLKRSCSMLDGMDASEMNEMQINSNCKPQEKAEVLKAIPPLVEVDMSNSGGLKKQISSQNDKNSNMSSSNSRSSSEQNQYSHYSSKTISLQSRKYSNQASSQKESSTNKLNFSKKLIKKQSQSLSEGLSESGLQDLKNTAQFNPIQKHFDSQNNSNDLLVDSYKFQPSEQIESVISNKIQAESIKFRIKKINQHPEKTNTNHLPSEIEALGMQSFSHYNSKQVFKIPLKPINEKSSKFQNQAESYNEQSYSQSRFKVKKQNSSLNCKEKQIVSPLQQRFQANIVQESKKEHQHFSSQFDLFNEIQIFLQYQENEYNKPHLTQQMMDQLPDQLNEVLKKIQVYLDTICWMTSIVHFIPEVYELESIYNHENEWILLSIFLTLKKCFSEKTLIVAALAGGGKNCFKSINCIIQDQIMKKYIDRAEVVNIMNHVRECNIILEQLIKRFYQFLIQFNSSYANHPIINLTPFSNDEHLFVLLSYLDQQIDILLFQREEQLKHVSISQDNEEQLVMAKIQERIFRLMEMGFILSNLSGKQIKAVEYDEYPYSDEKQFKNYLFQNHQQFKEVIKYFK